MSQTPTKAPCWHVSRCPQDTCALMVLAESEMWGGPEEPPFGGFARLIA